jgi:hypothetical protein
MLSAFSLLQALLLANKPLLALYFANLSLSGQLYGVRSRVSDK